MFTVFSKKCFLSLENMIYFIIEIVICKGKDVWNGSKKGKDLLH